MGVTKTETIVAFICDSERVVSKHRNTKDNDCSDKTEADLTAMMKNERTYRRTFDTFRHEYIYRNLFMKVRQLGR